MVEETGMTDEEFKKLEKKVTELQVLVGNAAKVEDLNHLAGRVAVLEEKLRPNDIASLASQNQ
jgi:hypothetical protein